MTASLRSPHDVPALRLWDPSSLAADPGALTLREFFQAHCLPRLVAESRKPATIAEYWSAIRKWEARTSNPPIASVDRDLLREFLTGFGGYSAATVRKIQRHLLPIFRLAAPESDYNPDGMGVIPRVPRVKLRKPPATVKRLVANAEYDALYAACGVARWRSPAWWRCALVCLANLGPRTWDLFCTRPRDPQWSGWRWDWLNWHAKSLQFVAEKTQAEVRVPLHPVVLAHLRSIRTDRMAIFSASANKGRLYREWDAICREAGIPVEGPEAIDFHDMRKTCQTAWDRIQFGFGDVILAHAPRGVGAEYYRDFRPEVFARVEEFPQPESFVRGAAL